MQQTVNPTNPKGCNNSKPLWKTPAKISCNFIFIKCIEISSSLHARKSQPRMSVIFKRFIQKIG